MSQQSGKYADNSVKREPMPTVACWIALNEQQRFEAFPLPPDWQYDETIEDPNAAAWIHIEGLSDAAQIAQIAKQFGLHPLVTEDILDPKQRPKLEDYGNCLFLILRDYPNKYSHRIETKQVSVAFGKDFLLTVQESPGEPFETVLNRIQKTPEHRRTTDEIAYLFIDTVIDNLFLTLNRFGDQIEKIEDKYADVPDSAMLRKVHNLRREINKLRRSIWPLHEAINHALRSESPLLRKPIRDYLRDASDHVNRAIESVEAYRDSIAEMLDLYLSNTNTRMNEVMKLLTIISTIFIPLNFVAAVYGMNFRYMPELDWTWGYGLFWLLITGIGVGMLSFFRRKRWV